MKTSLNYLHHQSAEWIREVTFYKEELNVLKTRLGDVVSRNTDTDILAQVEHFENKFKILSNNLDVLKHDINLAHEEVIKTIAAKPDHSYEKTEDSNDGLAARVSDLTADANNTRQELTKFLSKTL
jgi:seryl-tRNA synthetase